MNPRDYLASLEFHGIKLGLDNIVALLERAGNPQNGYPTVHVAGTNGKGSVLAFLDAILRAAGYRTGRFTSPHLIDVSERFLISGEPIPEAKLDEQISFFREIAETTGIPVTYFEMVTAIACNYFNEARVDIALIEVGMGGRFDATNVVHPIATAITPIDLDHMQYLGDTLGAIAGEKAGILKPSIPAVIGETRSPAREVLLRRAEEIGAPAIALGHEFSFRAAAERQPFRFESGNGAIDIDALGLQGEHQAQNAAIAIALAESIRGRFPNLTPQKIRTGVDEVRWPCRLERVLDSPPVIIDAAHNPAALEAVEDALAGGIVILAVSRDKHAEAMVRIAERAAYRLVLTQYQGRRAMPPEELAAFVSSSPCDLSPSIESAVDYALPMASEEHPLAIVGSIFAAGEARRYLIERYGAAPMTF